MVLQGNLEAVAFDAAVDFNDAFRGGRKVPDDA